MQLSVPPNPDVPCAVALEDPAFLVFAKPAGVVTQPGVGHRNDTLLNAAFALHDNALGKALQNLGRARDFGLVHRLDRPTSGLVIVARTAAAYDHLRDQFARRTVEKTYLALVHGAPRPPAGTERTPLREVRDGGRKRARPGTPPAGRPAVTRYKTLVRARGISLVECAPKTGRLHQIRAHLALRGAPVLGDREYGWRDPLDARFAKACRGAIGLHAAVLAFAHPVTGARVRVRQPLPTDVLAFLQAVGLSCPRGWR